MSRGREDRQVAFCFLLLAAIWGYLTLQIPPTSIPGTPGPRFFPWLLVTGLVILSLVMLVGSLRQPADEKQVDADAKKDIDWIGLGTLAMFFVYVWMVDLIGLRWGTLVMMPFFLFVSFRLRNIMEIALITLVLAFGVDFVFRVLLKMALPMGSIF
ncbi:tripartite tricarboxylate transporter TctB family protein [Moorella sulfitireducens (nom. illeg.)]|uniref:tripartite tricarboxylate transporter TctB family protein n=1 Tax=Neomoorella sulfitireducens TaxID=2972948 RepID=UPI0021ACABCB|nr:tripartite tricarboxylate transporter TctB family protein [Moorella sulfitireducens]